MRTEDWSPDSAIVEKASTACCLTYILPCVHTRDRLKCKSVDIITGKFMVVQVVDDIPKRINAAHVLSYNLKNLG